MKTSAMAHTMQVTLYHRTSKTQNDLWAGMLHNMHIQPCMQTDTSPAVDQLATLLKTWLGPDFKALLVSGCPLWQHSANNLAVGSLSLRLAAQASLACRLSSLGQAGTSAHRRPWGSCTAPFLRGAWICACPWPTARSLSAQSFCRVWWQWKPSSMCGSRSAAVTQLHITLSEMSQVLHGLKCRHDYKACANPQPCCSGHTDA